MPELPQPSCGEIWDVDFPSDPPGKGPRPVLIVSTDVRNKHPKASTVLVVPFSTTLSNLPIHIRLSAGQTGLPEVSELQPENISAVRKEYLRVRGGTRPQSKGVILTIAKNLVCSLGLQPKGLALGSLHSGPHGHHAATQMRIAGVSGRPMRRTRSWKLGLGRRGSMLGSMWR